MNESDFAPLVGPAVASALAQRGYARLTPVQVAVLDSKLAGRDLRITSQTGSGKTVAIGLALRELAAAPSAARGGVAHPRAIVVVPTRELAKQVEEELSWLYAPMHARVVSATGGASARDERRSFAGGPAVIVGTPGRLLDHLQRGSIASSEVGAIVIDEADRMLDLGFREDLEAILGHAPAGHRTHLVSATFPRDVRALADRVQDDPAHVEGTPLGTANADIDHVVHLVAPRERVAAIVNLLLATPGAQTLIFARTRADVAELAAKLGEAGFAVRALSGEMDQPERNKALAAFKKGTLHALVATDVAARGLDVQDIAGVIHAEPPTDADSYTHRSGRTGRAGRKGISSVLVSPAGMARTSQLLRRAGIRYRIKPIPSAEEIRASMDDRLFAALTDPSESDVQPDDRTWSLAKRLVATGDPTRALAVLLTRSRSGGPAEPREVHTIEPSAEGPRARERGERGERPDRGRRPERGERIERPERGPEGRSGRSENSDSWVTFRVSWGQEQGADPRRLLAMVCRRGGIRGSDVGAIKVERAYSTVDIASIAARAFALAAREPDPRDPRVVIHPADEAVTKAPRDGIRAESRVETPVERRPPPRVEPRGEIPAERRSRPHIEPRVEMPVERHPRPGAEPRVEMPAERRSRPRVEPRIEIPVERRSPLHVVRRVRDPKRSAGGEAPVSRSAPASHHRGGKPGHDRPKRPRSR